MIDQIFLNFDWKIGDEVNVKVIGIDNQGRINLSMKAAKDVGSDNS